MTEDRVIGRNEELPWHYPEDLKYFKQKTTGFPVIMGRKTYESLPDNFTPLPNRTNIVLTRSQSFGSAETASSLDEAYRLAEDTSKEKCFIIGGENVYLQTLDDADRLLITEIHDKYDGDSFFPEFKEKWVEKSRDNRDELSFVEYIPR